MESVYLNLKPLVKNQIPKDNSCIFKPGFYVHIFECVNDLYLPKVIGAVNTLIWSDLSPTVKHYIKVLFLCIIIILNQSQVEIIETGIRRKTTAGTQVREEFGVYREGLPLCQQDFIFKVMAEHLAGFNR